MKRRTGAALAIAAAALVAWRAGAHALHPATAAADRSAAGHATAAKRGPVVLGALRGAIVDPRGAPVAAAHVCAHPFAELGAPRAVRCALTDERGDYAIPALVPGPYRVTAGVRPYLPATRTNPDGTPARVAVPSGDTARADLVLYPGGVEVTGAVADITGGPIAAAQVRSLADANPTIETNDRGEFSLWVAPGDVELAASADGYAPGHQSGTAPGHFELRLAPASSVSGTVVDAATHEPVAGVHVDVSSVEAAEDGEATTDDAGAFLVENLAPGRYSITARSASRYGVSSGTFALGLGERVADLTVEVAPAFRVAGRVLVEHTGAPCPDASFALQDLDHGRRVDAIAAEDGTLAAEGVLPGHWEITPTCPGYVAKAAYPPIDVTDRDVDGRTWELARGGTVRGRVTAADGSPVVGATVSARGATATSVANGAYELIGLEAGGFSLDVTSDRGCVPESGYTGHVELGQTITQDIVLDPAGIVRGIVVDGSGAPVAGAELVLESDYNQSTVSQPDGTFELRGLRPGDARLFARSRGQRLRNPHAPPPEPDSDDDSNQYAAETVHVGANEVAHVRLVVEAFTGTIAGVVVDADGHPVADAHITLGRDQRSHDPPLVTDADGRFRLAGLRVGTYDVYAARGDAGSAMAENVETGTTVRLQFAAAGTISGTVAGAEEITVSLGGAQRRTETFFHTRGAYTLKDLTPGTYQLSFETETGTAEQNLTLGEGEHATLDVEIEPVVTVTARFVEGGLPIAGIPVQARCVQRYCSEESVTDERGRITLHRWHVGSMRFIVNPPDDSPYATHWMPAEVPDAKAASYDAGDFQLVRKPPEGASDGSRDVEVLFPEGGDEMSEILE